MNKENKIKIITIISGLFLMAGAVFLFWNYQANKGKQSDQSSFPFGANLSSGLSDNSIENSRITAQAQQKLMKSELNRAYFHPQYKFSFEYPGELKVSSFQEGDYGEIVLVQKADEGVGFQIFIAPFDEPGLMTKQRILQDLPDMVVDQPQHVIIGQDKITALIFFSHEPSLGKTREVWFIHNGHLYQLSTLAGLDGFIGRILETWRFQ